MTTGFGKHSDIKVPFTILSNGGGDTEAKKAAKLNQRFELDPESGVALTEKELLLGSSVYRDPSIVGEYRDKLVLIEGYSSDDVAIAKNYGFTKVITLLEVLSLYPAVCETSIIDL